MSKESELVALDRELRLAKDRLDTELASAVRELVRKHNEDLYLQARRVALAKGPVNMSVVPGVKLKMMPAKFHREGECPVCGNKEGFVVDMMSEETTGEGEGESPFTCKCGATGKSIRDGSRWDRFELEED